MPRKKNIDVMWKKEYWERILEQMTPKKRIQVERWISFDRFVITIEHYPPNVNIPINLKTISSTKAKKIMQELVFEGKSPSVIKSEITRTVNYIKKYLRDNDELFTKVLVEEGIWPKDDTDTYEKFGAKTSDVKYGFVYFIKNEDIYKIGITDNLMRRLNELKPDEVINTVRCSNYETLEKQLHKKFKKQRIPQTEYFRLTQNLIQQVIDEMTKGAIL